MLTTLREGQSWLHFFLFGLLWLPFPWLQELPDINHIFSLRDFNGHTHSSPLLVHPPCPPNSFSGRALLGLTRWDDQKAQMGETKVLSMQSSLEWSLKFQLGPHFLKCISCNLVLELTKRFPQPNILGESDICDFLLEII